MVVSRSRGDDCIPQQMRISTRYLFLPKVIDFKLADMTVRASQAADKVIGGN